jgi:hypothetical protein
VLRRDRGLGSAFVSVADIGNSRRLRCDGWPRPGPPESHPTHAAVNIFRRASETGRLPTIWKTLDDLRFAPLTSILVEVLRSAAWLRRS